MPWLLFALVGVTGALLYETNKKPSFSRYLFDFGPADTPATFGLLLAAVTAATPGGTVVNQGGGKYLITVPYQFDLSHALPPSLVPATGAALPSISGDENGFPRKEYNLQVNDDRFEGGPQVQRNWGGGFDIAGHRWNGRTLT